MSQDCICVRIEFDKCKIDGLLKKDKSHYQMKKVRYFNKDVLREMFLKDKRDLAFVKHFSYEEEKEIRIVYRGNKSDKRPKNMPKAVVEYLREIPKEAIKGIRFSPYVSKELFDYIKEPLYKWIKDKGWKILNDDITRSQILDYPEWKKIVDGTLPDAVKKTSAKNAKKTV